MILDKENHESRFEAWKSEALNIGVVGISKANSDLMLKYILDMSEGKNIARGSKKGKRSFHRCNTLRSRLKTSMLLFENIGVKDITKATEEDAHNVFNNPKRLNGEVFQNVADLIKDFKSFWHWLILTQRKLYNETKGKKGKLLEDITANLDTSKDENSFVHFTLEEYEQVKPFLNIEEQTITLFNFDTIIRSGKEMSNVKVSDLHNVNGDIELSIRDETAKTYGRVIKLLLCKEAVREHIKRHNLKDDDFLFDYSAPYINRKLKKVFLQVFGDKMTKGGKKFSEISLYDFRHSGACYWRLGAYRSKIDALMYRGGWNNLAMLNYYTKKIGMKDSIEKSDLLIDVDKHELEIKLEQQNRKIDEMARIIKGILETESQVGKLKIKKLI